MPSEYLKMCRECEFGKVSQVRAFDFPLSPIPSTIVIPPKVTRLCLSRPEVAIDAVANSIEDKIGVEVMPNRIERRVSFAATCVKPEMYSPKKEEEPAF